MQKTTELSNIGFDVAGDGMLQVKLNLCVWNENNLIERNNHIFNLKTGVEIDEVVNAINQNVINMGYPAMRAETVNVLKSIAAIVWTPARIDKRDAADQAERDAATAIERDAATAEAERVAADAVAATAEAERVAAEKANAPYEVKLVDLIEQLTDAETQTLLDALGASSVKLNAILQAGGSVMSDNPMFQLLNETVIETFGVERAVTLMGRKD